MNNREHAKWFHNIGANEPAGWYHSARRLIRASSLLQASVKAHTDNLMEDIVAVQAMLLGLAIECALKGKYVKDGGRLTDAKGRFVGVPGAGDHDLVQLADAAKCNLSDDERTAFRRLNTFVEWAGRYPVPLNWEKMLSTTVGARGPLDPRFILRQEIAIAESVFGRLENEIAPPLPEAQ